MQLGIDVSLKFKMHLLCSMVNLRIDMHCVLAYLWRETEEIQQDYNFMTRSSYIFLLIKYVAITFQYKYLF